MNIEKFQESMYKLIVETSTKLPKDVRRSIKAAKERENAGTRSALSLALKWQMTMSRRFVRIQVCQLLKSKHQLEPTK
jgi:tartrate dehydratase alpha subunit/fumarate hydratase class I-like protein